MDVVELVVVAVAAVATAWLTALAGAGGGLVLLLVLVQVVEPAVAVPLHGLVQLVSNGARAVALRGDVEMPLLRRYVLPLVVGTAVGVAVAGAVPVGVAQVAIGAFALAATWWPASTAWLAPASGGAERFGVVGAVAGVTNPVLGAPGPLLAPAFRAATSSHVAMVATFAVAQVLNHAAKVVGFAVVGVAWRDHLGLLVVAWAGVLVGTRLGTVRLRRADPAVLGRVFAVVVTVGAVRLVLSGLGL